MPGMQMPGGRKGRRIGWQQSDQRIAGLMCHPARCQIVLLVKQLNTLQALCSEAIESPRCQHLDGLARDAAVPGCRSGPVANLGRVATCPAPSPPDSGTTDASAGRDRCRAEPGCPGRPTGEAAAPARARSGPNEALLGTVPAGLCLNHLRLDRFRSDRGTPWVTSHISTLISKNGMRGQLRGCSWRFS
jgi:hypothetical protein